MCAPYSNSSEVTRLISSSHKVIARSLKVFHPTLPLKIVHSTFLTWEPINDVKPSAKLVQKSQCSLREHIL